MSLSIPRDRFLESAKLWICDPYSIEICLLATVENGAQKIIDATIHLGPLPIKKKKALLLRIGSMIAGYFSIQSLNKERTLDFLNELTRGELRLPLPFGAFVLETAGSLGFYSEVPHRDTWFHKLNLKINGGKLTPLSREEASDIDTALRKSMPPFDGMEDLCRWLNVSEKRSIGRESEVNVQISPPVDLIFDQATIHNNKLNLRLETHPKFDITTLGVSIHQFPSKGLESRQNLESRISWGRSKGGRKPGQLKLDLENADSLIVMLTLGATTVRRQWFSDPDKAQNSRYVATHLYDKELKLLRQSLLDSSDADRFEKAVASLLFLLGFSSAIQVETDAPDVIVGTPLGKVAIVECTTRIADFQRKLGLLVDRKGALKSALVNSHFRPRVDAFLVCGLPKAQIAIDERQLTQHGVTLLCREELTEALNLLRFPQDPDQLLDRAHSRLENARNIPSSINK